LHHLIVYERAKQRTDAWRIEPGRSSILEKLRLAIGVAFGVAVDADFHAVPEI